MGKQYEAPEEVRELEKLINGFHIQAWAGRTECLP